ncbi:hypothetical protein BH09ACT6_BH09ACT6_02700 [soil metagenome]
MGIAATVVLVLAALVCAVVVSMFSPHGRTDTISLSAAGSARSSAGVPPTGRDHPGAGEPEDGRPEGTPAQTATSPPVPVPSGSGSATPRSTSAAGGGAGSSAATGGAIALVHVLGAVAVPGLYELHAGDRVVDAIGAAGGFTPAADQGQQNLARVIKDGEQIVIPERGAAPALGSVAAGAAAQAAGGSAAGQPGVKGVPAPPVNLNTADQGALETLPHVGPALAQRIIAWRSANGQFTQVDDLKNVAGIGDKTFAELQPLVTV